MNVFCTPFMRLKVLKASIFLLLLCSTLITDLTAQCSLACRGTTQISLDMNCEATITPMMILEDEGISCPAGIFEVEVSSAAGVIPTSPIVNKDYVGQTLTVTVRDTDSGNSCWGYIIIEDKLGPQIDECPTEPYEFSCSKFNVFPGPTFIDACEGQVPAVLVSESIVPLDCDPDFIKEITRTYTAYDSHGVAAPECTVVYRLRRIALDEVVCPPNFQKFDGTALNCDGSWDKDDCLHATFAGDFDPANWALTIAGPGGGTDGNVDVSAAPRSVTLNATTDGTAGDDTNTDLCIDMPCSGWLNFDWSAVMIDGAGGEQFINDEPAYVLNGVETILPSTVVGNSMESGNVNIPVLVGDQLCFRVWSMNRNAWTSLTASNIVLSGQYGIVLDTDSDGDGILDTEENCRWDDDNDGYPDAEEVGVPELCGVPLYPISDLYCNSGVFYTDIELPTNTSCSVKIMRSWEVREWWCGDEIVAPCTQIIEIMDDEAPEISCLDTEQCVGYTQVTTNTSMYGVTTVHGVANCGAEYFPPMPTITDNCSVDFEIDVAYPGGFIDDYDGTVGADLMMGQNEITVTVYDQCYNSAECTFIVDVVDDTPPVAICDEFTVTSLTNNGEAVVYAETFDDGSHDDCILKKHLVRRMDPNPCECHIPVYPDMVYLGEYNNHHYYVSKDNVNWYMARDLSEAMGGYLVRLESMAESDWVYNAAQTVDMDQYYIDLSDQNCDDVYTYSDGTIPSYTNWATGQPNGSGQFVLFRNNTPFWNDVSGESRLERYVMELEDPCNFSHKVNFCCADVGQDVMVVYRTIDVYGNWNECMVTVEVQDKLGPSIQCPPHVTVECDYAYDIDNLTDLGVATAIDNCEDVMIVETVDNKLNQCNIGTLERTFTATDAGGVSVSCTQTITFRNNDPFDEDNIVWPDTPYDYTECLDPNTIGTDETGVPTYLDDQCDLLGANYTDEIFYFNNTDGNACFKILRLWRVIDWCQLIDTDNDGEPDSNPIWEYTQVIKGNNFVAPTINEDCDLVWVCTYEADCEDGPIVLTKSATDDCTDIENLSWLAEIDVDSDGTYDLTSTATGGSIDISGNYPIGEHLVKWSVVDRCGNVETCIQPFTIYNCKAPTPYCINGLAVDLMPMDSDGDGNVDTGMVELWASDFDLGSSHPCGYDVVVSFSEDITETNMIFDCTTLGDVEVNIYATAVNSAGEPILDHDGNPLQAFCITFINVQDNMDVCPDGPSGPGGDGFARITGTVQTENGEMLNEVNVTLDGGDMDVMTDDSGDYAFPDMSNGGNYIVNPFKDDAHVKAVSTVDIVLIQRHILNLENLTSPYKMIAADANNDQTVSASDLVDIRKLILEYTNVFPNNEAWRFVDMNYNFLDPANPNQEPFTETYEILNLANDMVIDFIAMKVGDVNNSYESNLTGEVEARSSEDYILTLGQPTHSGSEVSIPVYGSDIEIFGSQIGIEYKGSDMEIVGISSTQYDANNADYRIDNNTLLLSFNSTTSVNYDVDQPLFVIKGITSANAINTTSFAINNAVLQSEVYDAELLVMNPVLATSQDVIASFELFQNKPNPFKGRTAISFRLPAELDANLTIRDITGKVVFNQNGKFSKGIHTITIDQASLSTSGILYYTLDAGEFTATKKMVVIE